MKLPPFEYHAASSVDEVVALLGEYGEDAKILAGGQSLIPLLALRLARPEHLIDINGVHELETVENTDSLRLGSLVRHRVVERSTIVADANPLLSEAVRFIGHTAIRNRGTIGGSIAHADPSAELPALLLALDGRVELTSPRGRRAVMASELFLGFMTTAVESDEILTEVQFPSWSAGTGWSFQEFSRRSGDFGVAGVAVTLRLDSNGAVAETHIAVSGVDVTPIRATKAEEALVGQAPSEESWLACSAEAAKDLEPPSDLHGSSAYRRQLVGVLTRRALRQAHLRAEVGS